MPLEMSLPDRFIRYATERTGHSIVVSVPSMSRKWNVFTHLLVRIDVDASKKSSFPQKGQKRISSNISVFNRRSVIAWPSSAILPSAGRGSRSEERRVGKECRYRLLEEV